MAGGQGSSLDPGSIPGAPIISGWYKCYAGR